MILRPALACAVVSAIFFIVSMADYADALITEAEGKVALAEQAAALRPEFSSPLECDARMSARYSYFEQPKPRCYVRSTR